jgi:hypothetical protein
MGLLRSLLVLLISMGLYFGGTAVARSQVEWYTADSGGVVAGPAPTYQGGGALAPSLDTGTTPSATPNLPPPTEAPKPDQSPPAEAARATSDAPSSSPGAARAPVAHAAAAPAAQPAASTGDSLPFTGLTLAMVVCAGLCLLLAGYALRPRPARR